MILFLKYWGVRHPEANDIYIFNTSKNPKNNCSHNIFMQKKNLHIFFRGSVTPTPGAVVVLYLVEPEHRLAACNKSKFDNIHN